MATGVKNKWLDSAEKEAIRQDLDEHLMNAWASDAKFGDFINSLPDNLRKAFFDFNFECPVVTNDGLVITFVNPD
jgi:hypothetical protein